MLFITVKKIKFKTCVESFILTTHEGAHFGNCAKFCSCFSSYLYRNLKFKNLQIPLFIEYRDEPGRGFRIHYFLKVL